MNIISVLCILLVSNIVYSLDVKYKVIAFPREYNGAKVALILDGTSIEMKPSYGNSLWTVMAAEPTHDFHFAIISSANKIIREEALNREWTKGLTESQNYLFGKMNNNYPDANIVSIPRAYERLENENEFSKIYQEGEIQVINIIADENVLNNLHSSTKLAKVGANSDTTVEMAFLENGKERYFTNVTLSFSGMGTRGYAKRPYKIKLSDGENDTKENRVLYGRKNFKLRNLIHDCTYVKQKLVADISHSMGVLFPQVGFARLYMNGVPYGLYELTDNPKKNWIKKVIHIDTLSETQEVGSYYKGVSYSNRDANGNKVFIPATFRVEPSEKDYEILYECEIEENGQKEYTELKKFISWLSTISTSSTEEEIRSKFEVDFFLKYMAIEYLAGHWDGYWIGGNNFYLYHNTVTDKYLVIAFDFDLTLGIWDKHPAETSYSVWGVSTKSTITPVLIDKILKHPAFNKLFEEYLVTAVQKVFNINALGPRLDYFKELLYEEIRWDRSVKPKAVALSERYEFTLEESMKAYETEACEAEYGVKEWITARSKYVAQQFSVTIPDKLDFKLGEVGKKIVKIKANDKNDGNVKGSKTNTSSSNKNSTWSIITITIFILNIIYFIY